MSLFNIFRPKQADIQEPDVFESLAAISKFAKIRECSPEFYDVHYDPIDMAEGLIGFLGNQNQHLGMILSITGVSVADTAAALRQEVPKMGLEQRTIEFLDSTMTVVMRRLLPLLDDPQSPSYLEECRHPIRGAFE